MRQRARVASAGVLLIVLALAGCSPVVSMTPAADFANDPGCAAAIVRMPGTLGDYALRNTDAQGTAAWGEPTVALLYCGVPVPQASDLPCVEIEGIFWLREEVDAGLAFTTYGRDPAVRLVLDDDALNPGIALNDIARAVSYLPTNDRECVDLEDTVSPNP
jgi:hypothetical protein